RTARAEERAGARAETACEHGLPPAQNSDAQTRRRHRQGGNRHRPPACGRRPVSELAACVVAPAPDEAAALEGTGVEASRSDRLNAVGEGGEADRWGGFLPGSE